MVAQRGDGRQRKARKEVRLGVCEAPSPRSPSSSLAGAVGSEAGQQVRREELVKRAQRAAGGRAARCRHVRGQEARRRERKVDAEPRSCRVTLLEVEGRGEGPAGGAGGGGGGGSAAVQGRILQAFPPVVQREEKLQQRPEVERGGRPSCAPRGTKGGEERRGGWTERCCGCGAGGGALVSPPFLTSSEELAGQVTGRARPLQPLQQGACAVPPSPPIARGVLGGERVEVACEHEGGRAGSVRS